MRTTDCLCFCMGWGAVVCSHWLIEPSLSLFPQLLLFWVRSSPSLVQSPALEDGQNLTKSLNHLYGPTWPGHPTPPSLPFSQKAEPETNAYKQEVYFGKWFHRSRARELKIVKWGRETWPWRYYWTGSLYGQLQLHPARPFWGHGSSVPTWDGGSFIHQQSHSIHPGLLQRMVPWHFQVCLGTSRTEQVPQASSHQAALGAQWYGPYLLSWSSKGQSQGGIRQRRCWAAPMPLPSTHNNSLSTSLLFSLSLLVLDRS